MMLVCVSCKKFYRPKKNGVVVEEGMPFGPGTIGHAGGMWVPYKLWMADLLKCNHCGHEIIAGFGREPISEHYREDYNKHKAMYPPFIFVEDC